MKRIKKTLAIFLTVLTLVLSVPISGLTAFAFEADEPVFIFEEINEPMVPEGYYLTGKTNVDENGSTIYHVEETDPVGDIIHEMWIDANGNEVQNPDYPLAYPVDKNGEQILMGDTLPTKYDARDEGLVTPVEYQVGGTCWAHAGVAVIETAYLKKFGKTYDLSEYHTAWFGKNSYYSDENASGNDGVTKADVIGVLNDGGNMSDVSRAMGNFSGGVLESRYPFKTEDHGNCLTDTALIQEMQNTFTYDTRYQQDAILESIKAVFYDVSALKQAVLDYGAVQIAYYSDDAYYNYKDSNYRGWYVGKYQSDFQVAFYHPTMSDTNHAVTLVGWDDSFSRENFGTYKPENDGAWLVKNSWSSDWGNDGYFWISYEDKSMQAYPSYVVEVGDTDEYEDVYLYDGLGYSGSTNTYTASANVFTAENDIYLSKISHGSNATRDYTLKIYKGLAENATDPTAGTLVLQQSGNTYGEKYISLEGDVKLQKGEHFSVVLEMDYIYYEGTSTGRTCNAGDSFYYKSGSWIDATETTHGNACIRAIGKFREESDTYKVTFKDGKSYSETVTAINGVVSLPEKEGHTYVLTYNGTDFDGTGVTQDMTVNTHCYVTDGELSETNYCTTEYKCIYCGEEMKEAVTNHDYTVTVVPATVKSIGYTLKDCKNCPVVSESDYTLYEGADGGEVTVGSGLLMKKIWWQYIDGNLCVFPTVLSYKMPDFSSSSATPWSAYLNEITTITVGDNINYLGDYMFSDLPALKEVNLNDDITEIGDYCFRGAKALKKFDCPAALTKIGKYAFSGAVSLEEINYNDGIKTLGTYAYNGCTSLTEVIIPGTVTSVGTYLFYGCSSIEKITVEEGVTFVPYLVWNNSVLKEIVLPSTLTNAYFMNYTALEKYTVSPDNKVYCSVDGVVYSKDMKTLYAYPSTKADKYFAVPESVETINEYAFSYMKNLKYLDMSSCKVTSIIEKAFNQMQAVSYINLPEGLEKIESNGFYRTWFSKVFVPSTVTTVDTDAFIKLDTDSYYRIPTFYTDIETAKIKEFADTNGYTCTVLHTAHDFSTAMTDMSKDPTCKDEGTSLKICACGSFEYKTVPATGEHSLVKGETTAPTCTEAGYTVYTCSACGTAENKDKVDALGHDFDWIIDKDATCGEDGAKHEKCSRCDVTQSPDTVIPATGNHSYISEITTPATHLEEGIKTFTCSGCGDSYTEPIAKLEDHDYNAVVTAPTCTEKGYTTYTCACGDSYEADEVSALGHDFHWIIDKDATCGEDGAKHEKCSRCSVTQSLDTVIPATGKHSYTSEITTAPTCTEKGIETFTCSVCKDSYAKAVDEKGHTASAAVEENRVEAKCEVKGSYDEVVYCSVCTAQISRVKKDIPATGHSWDNGVINPVSTCKTHGVKTFTCLIDGTHQKSEQVALDGNNHEGGTYLKNNKEETCTESGYTGDIYCSGCNTKIESGETITASGHDTVKVDKKPPTCKEDGYEAYEYCVNCDYTTYKEIAATGHSYNAKVTAPTCTDKGYTTYICVCGDSYTADEVAALGHNYSSKITTEPTCTKDGTETFTCSGCGDSYTKPVDATGHSYNAKVTAPTCTDKGYTTYTCVCGDSYTADEVAALGHNYSSKITTEPTCTKDGTETFTCSGCGDSYTKPVDATGHSYNAKVTAPTCTDKGYTTYICVCGDSYVADEVAALGHNYSSKITTEPTCTGDGIETFTCSDCGDSYTKAIAASGHNIKNESAKAPTCKEAGYEAYEYCANCDYSTYKKLAPKGHSFGDWTVEKAATCSATGLKKRTCSVCGETERVDIAKTSHNLRTTAVAATCTEKGYTLYKCNSCSYSYKDNYVDTTGHSFGGDGVCVSCGYDKVKSCSCNCHKSGFSGFIWKILCFFYKLFKTNPVCACGAKHY